MLKILPMLMPGNMEYIKSIVPTPRGEMAFYLKDGILKYHLPAGVTGIAETGDGFYEIKGDGEIKY